MSWNDKYRPTDLDDLIGNTAVRRAFKSRLKSDTRAFLLSGPPGTGKTTLARIGAAFRNSSQTIEVNAANHTGVDEARELLERVRHQPLGGGHRSVILDEAHQLSKAAWNCLLKTLEEPPSHLTWFVCTTEPKKVIKAAASRCTPITLGPVKFKELFGLLQWVAEEEQLEADDKILQLVAELSEGCPRDAIRNLELVSECRSEEEVEAILACGDDDAQSFQLARAIMAHDSHESPNKLFELACAIEVPPETTRRIISAYFEKVVTNIKFRAQALEVLRAFRHPYITANKSNVLLSLDDLTNAKRRA